MPSNLCEAEGAPSLSVRPDGCLVWHFKLATERLRMETDASYCEIPLMKDFLLTFLQKNLDPEDVTVIYPLLMRQYAQALDAYRSHGPTWRGK